MAIEQSRPAAISNIMDKVNLDVAVNTSPSMSAESGSSMADSDSSPGTNSTLPTPALSPNDPTRVIRVLTKSECKQAGESLAQAFKDDPLSKYFTHTKDRKCCSEKDHWDLHVFIMQCIVRAHCNRGVVTVIGEEYDCVALWYDLNLVYPTLIHPATLIF